MYPYYISLYWFSIGLFCLLGQVNARIARGNSGGPVFNERGKCVGVLFQSTFFTSDVIAAPVINHFIEDYDKNGAYTGKYMYI